MKQFQFHNNGLNKIDAVSQSNAFKQVRIMYPNIKNVTKINLIEVK